MGIEIANLQMSCVSPMPLRNLTTKRNFFHGLNNSFCFRFRPKSSLHLFNKIEQILKIFKEKNCNYLLQAGDLFDNPRPSFDVLEFYIKLFNKYNINNQNFMAIAGQHDLRFRVFERTALKLMESLNYVTISKKGD